MVPPGPTGGLDPFDTWRAKQGSRASHHRSVWWRDAICTNCAEASCALTVPRARAGIVSGAALTPRRGCAFKSWGGASHARGSTVSGMSFGARAGLPRQARCRQPDVRAVGASREGRGGAALVWWLSRHQNSGQRSGVSGVIRSWPRVDSGPRRIAQIAAPQVRARGQERITPDKSLRRSGVAPATTTTLTPSAQTQPESSP